MKARYFCESCGSEVKAGTSVCPSCGRVFTAVRCPKCAYEGHASDFGNGCPVCGFLEAQPQRQHTAGSAEPAKPRAALPPWVYRVLLVALVAAAALLVVLIARS